MMMRNASDEERSVALSGFVNSCILAERRDRFLGFVRIERGLIKWLLQLDHFQRYLDIGLAIRIDTYKSVEQVIEALHLNEKLPVFAYSKLRGYKTGSILSLRAALDEIFLIGNEAIICSTCETDPFWFYLGEERPEQYFFR